MLKNIINWSIHNRFLVLVATVFFTGWGWVSLQQTPLDAIPDLSDVQVIIKTTFPGQSPRVVEDQVTYPITTTMLSVPGAQVVRGYSFFGDSYVYVIFKDGTDMYWARSRVLEYLNQAASSLPDGVQPRLGPDATGVGWVYSYALVDRTGKHDLSELRSLQDWFLKFELQTVSGVSEVATVGGMVRQYQVVVDPEKLRAFGIPLSRVSMAIKNANQEVGGSVIELAEAEYMIRTRGYLSSLSDNDKDLLIRSMTQGDNFFTQIGGSSDSSGYILSLKGRMAIFDFTKLEDARKSSKYAHWTSIIAICISIILFIINIFVMSLITG